MYGYRDRDVNIVCACACGGGIDSLCVPSSKLERRKPTVGSPAASRPTVNSHLFLQTQHTTRRHGAQDIV